MKLEFGPHIGRKGYLEYEATWVRTKKQLTDPKIEMYRILMKNYCTESQLSRLYKPGSEAIVYWQDGYEQPAILKQVNAPLFGSQIVILPWYDLNIISPTEIRNQSYRYYFRDNDPQAMHKILEAWSESNPLVHVGNYLHEPKDNLVQKGQYQWTYMFDGIKY